MKKTADEKIWRLAPVLTPEQHQKFEDIKRISGLSGNSIVRALIAGRKICAKPTAAYIRLLREINHIATNVGQIARVAAESGSVPPGKIKEMLYLSDELTKITRAM